MHPNGQDIRPLIGYCCLPLLFVFPAALLLPVINYLASIAAVFAVIYLAYNKMDILLTIGITGSLVVLFLIHGAAVWMYAFWGVSVIPGGIFGRAMASGINPRRAMIIGMITAMVLSIILFVMIREPFNESIDAMSSYAMTTLQSLDTSEALKADLADNFESVFEMTKRLAPGFLALNGVAFLFIGWLLLKLLLDMLRKFHPGLGSFIYWKMPQAFIYVTGLIILLRLIGPDLVKIFADNALLLVGFFYALFGFAVIEYYLKKIRLSIVLKVLLYLGIAFLQLPGLILAAAIGFLDSYFDFRKVRARLIG